MASNSELQLGDEEAPTVVLHTTVGDIIIELYWAHAPNACRNFAQLAKLGYYDNVPFHRVIHGFIAQGGDPTGTGRGGESIYGGKFANEVTHELKHVGAGVVSMANDGTTAGNGSQFFFTLAPCPSLDGHHTIFGRVKSGMLAVKRLSQVETDAYDRPQADVRITSTSVDAQTSKI